MRLLGGSYLPGLSVPIEPSSKHLCRCGEPGKWQVDDSFWKWGKLNIRTRYYCHDHHDKLLAARAKREEVRLLRQTLRITYHSLLKARRELHKRGLKDPTVPDRAQSQLGTRRRSWPEECS